MSEEDTSSPSSSSSSSSSEDEESSTAAPAKPQPSTESRNSRFQCPADFVSFSYKPSSTLSSDSSTELWLIKAPASFNPQSFSGVQLPLRSLETVSVLSADGTEMPYSVLGSSNNNSELRLLAPNTKLAPPFSGLISISESHSDCGADQALHVIPAIPPPSLPTGLKQRFQYFQTTTVSTQRSEEGSSRKRKRKKEKKIKSEPQETSDGAQTTPTDMFIKTEVKHEPLDTGFGELPEARKKKKKKKSKSAE